MPTRPTATVTDLYQGLVNNYTDMMPPRLLQEYIYYYDQKSSFIISVHMYVYMGFIILGEYSNIENYLWKFYYIINYKMVNNVKGTRNKTDTWFRICFDQT